jgi:hypothetical protein
MVTVAQATSAAPVLAGINALTALQAQLQQAIAAGTWQITSVSFSNGSSLNMMMSAADTLTLLNDALTAVNNDLTAANSALAAI